MAAVKTTKGNFKAKQDYIDLFEEMIAYYSKEDNKDLFDYKQYFFRNGFRIGAIKSMCIGNTEVNNLYIELKHIIIATLTRMILENKINKDVFAIRTMKLMFKDLSYHTPEEIAAIDKLKAERELDMLGAKEISFNIGYSDDAED